MIFSSVFLVSLWAMVDATPIHENSLKHVGRSYLLGRTNGSKMTGQRLFIDTTTCTNSQQEAVNEAWGDAALLAKAAVGKSIYDLKSKAQWFGIVSDRRRPTFRGPELSDWEIIEKNIARQLKFYDPNVAHGTLTFISCPSQHAECTPGVIAASADAQLATGVHHYTVFCPAFFNYNSLTQSLANVSNNQQEQMVMENYWGNQGYSFFHETYHYETTVSIPRLSDPCYGPANCWNLALSNNLGSTSHSADTYALEAMATFAQQHFNLTYVPVPRAISDNLLALVLSTPTSTASAAKSPQTQYYKALETVLADLFSTTNAIDAAGADLDPRWKLMVRSGSGGSGTSSVSILTSTESVSVSTSVSSGSMTESSAMTLSMSSAVTIPGGLSATDSPSVLPTSTISAVSATGVSSTSEIDSSSMLAMSTISGVTSSVASSSISDSSSVLPTSTISAVSATGVSSIETDTLSVLASSMISGTFSTRASLSETDSSSVLISMILPANSSVASSSISDSSSVLASSTSSTVSSPGTSSDPTDSSSPRPSSTISTSTLRGTSSSQTYSSSPLPSNTLSTRTASTSPSTTTSISTQPSPTSIFSAYFGTLPITIFSSTNTNAALIPTSSHSTSSPSTSSPSPSTTTTLSPPSPLNTSSTLYKTCITNLGASTCKANDGTCLTNQCLGDKACRDAGVACAEVGNDL